MLSHVLWMLFEAISSHNPSVAKERGDFLDHLRKVQVKDPGRMSDAELQSALISNLCVPPVI